MWHRVEPGRGVLDLGSREDLVTRGLVGVELAGLQTPTWGSKRPSSPCSRVRAGMRCRVHFIRNALTRVPKGAWQMVAAAIRTIFAAPDIEETRGRPRVHCRRPVREAPGCERNAARRRGRHDRAHGLPTRALVQESQPPTRLQWVSKEIKRRTDVVGIFPNCASALRLAGAVLLRAG